jgi:cytochrome c553
MNAHSFQGDIEDIAVQCIGCHGVSSNTRLLGFPNIAGQPSKYISEKLHDFKSGAKKSRIMRRVAARLSDQEIIDISNYFSNIKSKKTISTREYIGAGKDIFEKGIKGSVVACIKCHKLTVSKSKGYIPTLNLHHPIYIAKRLRQFRNNDPLKILTAGEKLMSFVASNLSDEDITSVSEYIGASK